MGSLLRSRTALVIPKKRTLEDLVNSKNVKALVPPLPREVAVSFYLQSCNLIFAVYHMVVDKGISRLVLQNFISLLFFLLVLHFLNIFSFNHFLISSKSYYSTFFVSSMINTLS